MMMGTENENYDCYDLVTPVVWTDIMKTQSREVGLFINS